MEKKVMDPVPVIGGFVDPEKNLVSVLYNKEQEREIDLLEPQCKLAFQGIPMAVFPQTPEILAHLWEMGLNISGMAPIKWRYVPVPMEAGLNILWHQLETAEFMTVHRRAFNTSDTRTGKTLAHVVALDYLNKVEPGAALIVCPLSVMSAVWESAIKRMNKSVSIGLLRGSKKKREVTLAAKHDYYIINYDGLPLLEDKLRYAILSNKITKVVIDELNHFGNPSAKRYQVAERLFNNPVGPVKYLWGLTGTPGADSQAVYGMCRLVNPNKMLWNSKTSWQGATQIKYGPEAWQWRDKPETPYLISTTMQPTIRYTREEILPYLPPIIRGAREAELSKEQKKYYDTFKEELIVEFEKSEGRITADQKSIFLGKLFQICLGSVITDNGIVKLDNTPRINLLRELIGSTDKKTVIYCHYIAAIDDLVEKLSKTFSVVKVDGTVTGQARDMAFRDFRERANPRVLIAHQKTVAYGVELAAADLLINNGPQMSGVSTYSQGMDRASSMEQMSNKIMILDVWASAEERDFANGLNERKNNSDIISNLFNSIVRREYE
ncbi:MAG: hypothetical protein LBS60_08780 [Deltaproteobacteria bacterium]|jgi:hypothetical protein|nr:hypothetical protein [Deltaproteobacteria bacterium]